MTDAAPREGWYILHDRLLHDNVPIKRHEGYWQIGGTLQADLPPNCTLGPRIDDLLRDAARYRWIMANGVGRLDDLYGRREAEIRATIAGRTQYDEWRMIDDQARNGEEWLLSARRGEPMEHLMIVGFWHDGRWHTADGPDYSPTAFTMYMPLPKPPHD